MEQPANKGATPAPTAPAPTAPTDPDRITFTPDQVSTMIVSVADNRVFVNGIVRVIAMAAMARAGLRIVQYERGIKGFEQARDGTIVRQFIGFDELPYGLAVLDAWNAQARIAAGMQTLVEMLQAPAKPPQA